jgi:predicted Holliday junction resolvase-like endonuclease
MVFLILLNSDLLLLVLLFMVMATAVVSLLWFLRERRLLRSLQALIAEEKMENLESKHSNPKDMKEALRALFETRKEELLQLQRLENYRRDYIGNDFEGIDYALCDIWIPIMQKVINNNDSPRCQMGR